MSPRRLLSALRGPGLLWVGVVVNHVLAVAVPCPFGWWSAGLLAGLAYCLAAEAYEGGAIVITAVAILALFVGYGLGLYNGRAGVLREWLDELREERTERETRS